MALYLPSKEKEQHALELLSNKEWRLKHLYKIKDKQGNVIDFDPNWAQQLLLKPHYLNIILKARQLGISTFCSLLFLDTCLFNDNVNAAIIADTRDIAKEIFVDKVKFAYDNLPQWVKQLAPAYRDNVNELRFANGSVFRIGTSVRGGTLQLLHITEFAKTCVEDPKKAEEIVTGALNTIQAGQFVCIESTARGKDGHFYDMVKECMAHEQAGKQLTQMDWKLWFFPWWQHPDYKLADIDIVIPQELEKYFASLENDHHIFLSPEQKSWYVKKARDQGDNMKREYPSTPDEAFETSNEGYFFASSMAQARIEKRICNIAPDSHVPKFAAFDIGILDPTAIFTFQVVGKEIHFLDYYENSGEPLEHYVKWLSSLPYSITKCYLPHDAAGRSQATGKAYIDYAREMGLNCTLLDIKHNKLVDIELTRNMFPNCWFNEKGTSQGIRCIENYRKEWNEKRACYRETPRHDWSSHGTDAFIYALNAVVRMTGGNSLSAKQWQDIRNKYI